MARTNLPRKSPYEGPAVTHEGGPAYQHITPMQALRRSVMSCMLWESEFYEDGKSIADRIFDLCNAVKPEELAALAFEARTVFNLRHAPLLLLVALTKTGAGREGLVAGAIEATIQRADELSEFVSLYWKDGKRPLSAQAKKGLARALRRFDGYALAKYNRDAAVKLRDVMFLCHAKPKDEEQAALWKQLADDTLPAPDTWEVQLSAGADKKEAFERLIRAGKLGYLALLRNLRNMMQAGCDLDLVRDAILARQNGAHRVLPFRFVAAARAAKLLEPAIDAALVASLGTGPMLPDLTTILVDVSGSMIDKLSAKSDMTRMDAAATLAAVWPGPSRVFTFSNHLVEVPPRKGMAGVDAIISSQGHASTMLGGSLAALEGAPADKGQLLVVITDEQSHDRVRIPAGIKKAYMINVASNRNGVGYGAWTHIDGFSEQVIRWIIERERTAA